jgi:chaperonin GroEL (HSP60 family)
MFEEKKVESNINGQEITAKNSQTDNNNNQTITNKTQKSEKSEKFDKIILDSLMISSYNLTKGRNFLDSCVTDFNNTLESEYKILNFTNKTKNNSINRQNISEYIQGLKRLTDNDNDFLPKIKKEQNERIIPSVPDRILDAPNLVDDYYLNLLDWSVDNVVSVGLGNNL